MNLELIYILQPSLCHMLNIWHVNVMVFFIFVLQELSIDEPCSCVCMADSFAIVGTDRFYKINFDHPTLTGMLSSSINTNNIHLMPFW